MFVMTSKEWDVVRMLSNCHTNVNNFDNVKDRGMTYAGSGILLEGCGIITQALVTVSEKCLMAASV
jgi:hypothetical protein